MTLTFNDRGMTLSDRKSILLLRIDLAVMSWRQVSLQIMTLSGDTLASKQSNHLTMDKQLYRWMDRQKDGQRKRDKQTERQRQQIHRQTASQPDQQ